MPIYILEAEIILGVLSRKGVIPKKGGTLASRDRHSSDQHPKDLRGPAAILFISRDAFSDSIATLYRVCFPGGIAQVSRDMLQNGVSH